MAQRKVTHISVGKDSYDLKVDGTKVGTVLRIQEPVMGTPDGSSRTQTAYMYVPSSELPDIQSRKSRTMKNLKELVAMDFGTRPELAKRPLPTHEAPRSTGPVVINGVPDF